MQAAKTNVNERYTAYAMCAWDNVDGIQKVTSELQLHAGRAV